MDDELAALAATTEGELERLGAEAELRRKGLDAMGRDQASWRDEVAEELRLLGRRCKRTAAAGIDELWLRIRAGYLYDKELLRDPERLMGRIAADAAALAASMGERAARDAATLQQEFTRRSGVDLGPTHVGSLPAPPVPGLALDAWLGGTEQMIESMRATTAGEAERRRAELEAERAPLLVLRDRIAAHVTFVEELWRATEATGQAG